MATSGKLVGSQIDASDALHDFACGPCSDDNKNTEAMFQCTDCQIFYCQRCVKGHNKFTRNHNVFDNISKQFGQGQRQPRSFSPNELPSDLCEEHHGEVIKMFCGQHDLLCCTVCIAVKHRSCEGVEYIPNIASGHLRGRDKDKTQRSLEKVKDDLQYLKSTMHVELKELSNQRDGIFEDIQKFKKHIIGRVEELANNSIKVVHDKHKEIVDEINANSKKIDDMLKDVEQQLDRLEHSKGNSGTQTFVDIKYGEKQVSDGNNCIKQSFRSIGKTLEYEINRGIETCLHDVQYIGKLYIESSIGDPLQSIPGRENNDNKLLGAGQIRPQYGDELLKCKKCGKTFKKSFTLKMHQTRC